MSAPSPYGFMAGFDTNYLRMPGLFDFDVQEVCDLTSLYMPETPYLSDEDVMDVYYTLRMRLWAALVYHHYILFALMDLNITFMYNDKAVDLIVGLRNLRCYIRMLWYMVGDIQQIYTARSQRTVSSLYTKPWEQVVDDGAEDAWAVWVFKSYSKWCQEMMKLHGDVDEVNRRAEREFMRFSSADLHFMSTDMGLLVDHYAHTVLKLPRVVTPWSRPERCSHSEWPTMMEYRALHFRMTRRDMDGMRGTSQAHL